MLAAAAVWIGSLMVRWILVMPMVVLDGRRWALEGSSRATRGHRWRCFLVLAVVGAVLSCGFGAILLLVAALGGGMERTLAAMAGGGNLALQLAAGLLGVLFLTAHYALFVTLAGGSRPAAGAEEAGSPAVPPEPVATAGGEGEGEVVLPGGG